MGHNIDMREFGLCAIMCSRCHKYHDISETDIDCDLKSRQPMTFTLSLQCVECGYEEEKTFTLIEVK